MKLLMKKYIYSLLAISAIIIFNACSDDDNKVGNPVMDVKTKYTDAMFGDSLPFSIDVSDSDVPLSTVKAQLFFDDTMVSETVIRTKTDGNYSGKVYIPFLRYIPNGTATLKFVLQNINFTIKEEVYDISLTRPDFPSLSLIQEDGTEYKMMRTAANVYTATEDFPKSRVKAYIKAAAMGEYGNDITFGWEDNAIIQNSESLIPFSNSTSGIFDITFNTLTYEASPFIIGYYINEVTLIRIDDNSFYNDYDLAQGDIITVEGIEDFEEWWIDPSFVEKNEKDELTFLPIDGKYRITANFTDRYLGFEPLATNGTDLASLQSDGSGAIWAIGVGIGKPSVESNEIGWDDQKAISLAPMGNKKYQITLVAGQTIKSDNINFKFFHQKGWGGEFNNTTLTTNSDLIFVGAKEEPGPGDEVRDPGNLGLLKGKKLEAGATYVFTIDVSEGNDKAVLTVEKK